MTTDPASATWAQEVVRALGVLADDEQAFIRMSYLGGVSQAGIAERSGVSVALVATTIAQGMQALGRALERPAEPVELGPAA